jgi:malonyl-CoA O-methyltransferase
VLEVGCGTGFLTGFLLEQFPEAGFVAVDLAGGMVRQASERSYTNRPCFVQADGERLPFAPGSFELAASSTAFQWFGSPADSIAGLAGLLAPGGSMMFATLGRGTLNELKESYREAAGRMGITLTNGRYGPLLLTESELVENLVRAGFTAVVTENITKREFFPGVRELFRSLKARGANNPNFRPMSLGTERKLMGQVKEIYERRFQVDGRVYASYDVIFGCCRRESQ